VIFSRGGRMSSIKIQFKIIKINNGLTAQDLASPMQSRENNLKNQSLMSLNSSTKNTLRSILNALLICITQDMVNPILLYYVHKIKLCNTLRSSKSFLNQPTNKSN
jgi:hypothetical protein